MSARAPRRNTTVRAEREGEERNGHYARGLQPRHDARPTRAAWERCSGQFHCNKGRGWQWVPGGRAKAQRPAGEWPLTGTPLAQGDQWLHLDGGQHAGGECTAAQWRRAARPVVVFHTTLASYAPRPHRCRKATPGRGWGWRVAKKSERDILRSGGRSEGRPQEWRVQCLPP